MEVPEHLIKKYPNRRLYDSKRSTYITLEDVRQYVLDQVPFRVIEANTGADITKSILLQILTDQETHNSPIFTSELLQHFIRAYGDQWQYSFSQYLEQMMGLFIQQKSKLQSGEVLNYVQWTAYSMELGQQWLQLQQQFWENMLNRQSGREH